MSIRIGSFCSGYRGLDQAVEEVFGGTTAWVSDVDPGANKILAHRWPATPNIGDVTTADWGQVLDTFGRPTIVCGGYPCQPFSLAGDLKGTEDVRHLWPFIAGALRVLRPRVAIFENVANHLRLGFDTVLCDLADLGFDVEWVVVRADEVGAPHQRRRLFILATATDAPHIGHERGGRARGGRPGSTDGRVAAAHAPGVGRGEGRPEPAGQQGGSGVALGGGAASADAERVGRQGQRGDAGPNSERSSTALVGRGPVRGRRTAADTDGSRRGPEQPDVPAGQPDATWGRFWPAVARWEAATGRRAPRATDDRHRLSPAFVEWMMGLPAGHVTDIPELTRTQQLKALGNGVVPQQAAAAIRLLADRAGMAVAA